MASRTYSLSNNAISSLFFSTSNAQTNLSLQSFRYAKIEVTKNPKKENIEVTTGSNGPNLCIDAIFETKNPEELCSD